MKEAIRRKKVAYKTMRENRSEKTGLNIKIRKTNKKAVATSMRKEAEK